MEEQKLKELEEQYGEIRKAELPDGRTIAVRRPTRIEAKRFMDKGTQDKLSKPDTIEEFVLACTVHPERGEAKAILADFPMLIVPLSVALQSMAGADIEIQITKS